MDERMEKHEYIDEGMNIWKDGKMHRQMEACKKEG